MLAMVFGAFGVIAEPGSAQSADGLVFTDWTATGGSAATGTLPGRRVTLSGWHLSDLPASYLDGTSTLFSAPYFTPPLPRSDAIEFRAENAAAHLYTLAFGAPTTNPVLHLGSLGTTLEFPLGTSVTRLSGENGGFAVSGGTISGAGDPAVDSYGLNDSNGTVRLNGTFRSISFTASTASALDGVYLQVGVVVPVPRTTIALNPPDPTADGSYDGRVSVRVTASLSSDGRPPTTRCVLDPPDVPTTFDQLPASCPYRAETLITAPDAHTLYAASRDSSGSTEAPLVSRAFRIAGGPPDTIITAGPAEGAVVDGPPAFEFRSTEPGSRFECNATWQYPVSTTGFRPCSSPQTVPPRLPWRAGLRFEVRAIDAAGNVDPTPAQRNITYQPPRLDLSLDGIEVTQGVQETACASSDGCRAGIMIPDYLSRLFGQNPPRRYQGVELSAARNAVARVYVQAAGDARYARGAAVRLFGFDGSGRPLGPGFLLPETGPAAPAACCASLSLADRGNPLAAYTFTLPASWSQHGTLRLQAIVSPRAGVLETRSFDNRLDVVEIPFKEPTTIRLRPVQMAIRGAGPPESPATAFAGALATFPDRFEIPPFQGVVDATDAAQEPKPKKQISLALELVDDWADDQDYRSGVFPFGLYPIGQGLASSATLGGWDFLFWSSDPRLYGDRTAAFAQSALRPLTAVAHELGHGLNLDHAGLKCGSNSGGQTGSAWPPDDEGRTNGFGLDTRTPPPYRILRDAAKPGYGFSANFNDGTAYWDLMSYCPNGGGAADSIHWLSPRNWTYLLNYYASPQALPARAAARAAASAAVARSASAPALGITVFMDDSGAISVQGVRRISAAPAASLPGSPWRVVMRDAAGRRLSDTGVAVTTIHSHEAGDAQMLQAKVPAAGAANIQIMKDGTVVAERRRSAHRPAVQILSPRRGTRLRGAKAVLRWRATDADHDPLTASLDYSPDGGGHWSTIFTGRDRGAVTLPTRLLTRSRNARLRVRANDGFNETAKISRRFASNGAPPNVSITPSRGFDIRADATLVAAGDAYDDAARRLSARSLTWRLGGRILGHGRQLAAVDLPAGRTRLLLTARDGHGRVGAASVKLRILGVAPRFVELKAPRSVRRNARRVRLRVTTNVSATLRIGRRRFHVTRTPRLLTVRIGRGRRPLRLRAVLSAGRRRSIARLMIGRG